MKTKIKYKMLLYYSFVLVLLFSALPTNAQINYSDFITGGEHSSYPRVAVYQRKIVPIPLIGEVDVKYSKRIIRCIDARQKMNKQLEWPRSPLNLLLYAGLTEGAIIPYRTDSLASSYNGDQFRQRVTYNKTMEIIDDPEDPDSRREVEITVDFDYSKIHKFWVMEDWVFDYKHSVFKPRIIAIAPIYMREFESFTAPEAPLCWIKMDDIRQLLANTEMFNRYNDGARLSYDDFFQMRIFDSYIVYESNVFDNYVNQFQEYENDQVGALIKSDEIKNDLFIFEHDLWQF
jgi:gliding motility associated protien GldN